MSFRRSVRTYIRDRQAITRVLFAAAVMMLLAVPARAAGLTVAWDASTEEGVAGYVVYVRTADSTADAFDVGNTVTYTLSSAVPGVTYYFSVAAYGYDGVVGDTSAEIAGTLPALPAPLPPLDPSAAHPLPRGAWTLHYVDSEDRDAQYAAGNAFDGDPDTFWHTAWQASSPTPPHELQINLGGTHEVNGFRYLPRQEMPNGRIGRYEFYVSADGVTWGTPVATGTLDNSAAEQEVRFSAKTGRYVRLRALSEVSGHPWSAVAELAVLSPDGAPRPPQPIARDGWTLHFVDSEDAGASYGASRAFDGDATTFWHTAWQTASPPPPHDLQINLGGMRAVAGFRYVPRQDIANGRIARYEFYVSTDGTDWGAPVAAGTLADSAAAQEVRFTAKPGRYIRLRALTEVNGRPWTSVAELQVLE